MSGFNDYCCGYPVLMSYDPKRKTMSIDCVYCGFHEIQFDACALKITEIKG
jgi:hypothetical protein